MSLVVDLISDFLSHSICEWPALNMANLSTWMSRAEIMTSISSTRPYIEQAFRGSAENISDISLPYHLIVNRHTKLASLQTAMFESPAADHCSPDLPALQYGG